MATVLALPFRFTAGLLRVLRLTGRSLRGPRLLPAGGVDEAKAQEVLALLRQAGDEGKVCAGRWLLALQLLQVTADRLYLSRKALQSNVRFWRSRLSSGQHRIFLLLSQGPIHFLQQVLHFLRLGPPDHTADTATAMIDAKLIALLAIDAALLEALAVIHRSAAQLGNLHYLSLDGHAGVTPAAHLREAGHSQRSQSAGTNASVMRTVEAQTRQAAQSVMQALEMVRQSFEMQAQQGPQQQRTISRSLTFAEPVPLDVSVDDALAIAQRALFATGIRHPSGQPPAASLAPPLSGKQLLAEGIEQLQGLGEAAWHKWQQAVVTDTHVLLGGCHSLTASEALSRAAVAAATHPLIMPLPKWTQAPSRYQQYWLRYMAATAVAAAAGLFLYRHSPLAGSDDLQRWTKTAVRAVCVALHENVEKPLLSLQAELFKTFRDRSSIVSREEYNTDREALMRMLQDFQRDKGQTPLTLGDKGATHMVSYDLVVLDESAPAGPSPSLQRTESDVVASGMAFLMRSYEEQLVHPLRNLLTGDLARSLLIQIQKVKVDSEGAMLEMDQILRANELSISLVAAIPALIIAYLAITALWRFVTPSAPDPVWEALPARLGMIELERAIGASIVVQQQQQELMMLKQQQAAAQAQPAAAAHIASADAVAAVSGVQPWLSAAGLASQQGGVDIAEGEVMYNLAIVYLRCRSLFLKHNISGSRSEWPQLRRDLMDLAATGQPSHRRDLALRMMRSYTIFQQFNSKLTT